jgi:V/A-type H+-transporting ATPase subunit F
MSDVAFIGDRDSVWAFAAFGISVRPVSGSGEASEALEDAVRSGFSVIFVTEDVYEACADEIARYRSRALPTITVLPNVRESRGLAAAEIHRAVSAAVGADILTDVGKS